MDKKYDIKPYEEMSSEEVHALLVEVMQDACTSDEAGPYQSPSIDLSFMDDEPVKEKQKKFALSRFNKVAAIIIIVLLSMNIVMLATESSACYSEKGLLHRIYEGARGIFTDEDESEFVEIDETGDICIITDFSQINEIKRFWPSIHIPNYVPEEFYFEKLIVKKEISGDYWAEYRFKNQEEYLYLIMTEVGEEIGFSSTTKGEIIELSDRTIFIYESTTLKSYIADILFEDTIVYIKGNVKRKELVKMSKEII